MATAQVDAQFIPSSKGVRYMFFAGYKIMIKTRSKRFIGFGGAMNTTQKFATKHNDILN